jgi:hypothetical protein
MMKREPFDENLIDELTRLVGRPSSVLRDALRGMLRELLDGLTPERARTLAEFPMTSWPALAPGIDLTRRLWSSVLSAGLTAEETFTTLAVVDDHARRRFGVDAWSRVRTWGPQLFSTYGLAPPPSASAPPRDAIS